VSNLRFSAGVYFTGQEAAQVVVTGDPKDGNENTFGLLFLYANFALIHDPVDGVYSVPGGMRPPLRTDP